MGSEGSAGCVRGARCVTQCDLGDHKNMLEMFAKWWCWSGAFDFIVIQIKPLLYGFCSTSSYDWFVCDFLWPCGARIGTVAGHVGNHTRVVLKDASISSVSYDREHISSHCSLLLTNVSILSHQFNSYWNSCTMLCPCCNMCCTPWESRTWHCARY